MATSEIMYMNDPEIVNKENNGNQPTCFQINISENLFNFVTDELFIAKEKVLDEDDRFFGTHIIEAKRIIKNALKFKK